MMFTPGETNAILDGLLELHRENIRIRKDVAAIANKAAIGNISQADFSDLLTAVVSAAKERTSRALDLVLVKLENDAREQKWKEAREARERDNKKA